MTLTEFLLARIAEDEAVARMASENGRYPSPDWWAEGSWWFEGKELLCIGKGSTGADVIAYAYVDDDQAHIARHDPTRVLAECEAKRRIVSHGDFPGFIARALAAPYADHEDYDESWRP